MNSADRQLASEPMHLPILRIAEAGVRVSGRPYREAIRRPVPSISGGARGYGHSLHRRAARPASYIDVKLASLGASTQPPTCRNP